jgi:O-antigen/teichoic acid export membrane protein
MTLTDELPSGAGVGRRSVNTAMFIFLSRMIGLVANVAAVLLITRYLGKEAFGDYAFVMGYSLFIGTLATGGTFGILIRETARDRSRAGHNLGSALQVQSVFTIVATTVAILLLPVFTREPVVVQAVYISVLASIIQVLANLFASLFTAFEDTRYLAISVFIERGFFLAGIALVVLFRWSFLAIFWVQVTSFLLKFIFCVSVVRLRFTRIVWRPNRERLRYFFRESLPLLFSTGFRTLDQQLDTFLLQLLQTAAELGLYGAPYRIISRLNIIPDSIMAGLLPALSNLVHAPDSKKKAQVIYDKLFKYFLVSSLPIAVMVSFLGQPLIVLLFGPDYADGASTLQIMTWAVVFMFPNYLFKYVLTAIGKQRLETISLAASLVMHLGIGLWLIPRQGAAGAAVAMLGAQIAAFVIGYIYVSRDFGAYHPWGTLLKLAAGGLPAAGIILLWPQGPIALQLLASGCAYLLVLVFLGVFERDEVALLWGAFQRRPRVVGGADKGGIT